MEDKKLRETLENLHWEIENTSAVSDESRELLLEVVKDIAELLGRSRDASCEGTDSSSVGERLKEVMLRLENDHPKLAKSIDKVVEALSAAGI